MTIKDSQRQSEYSLQTALPHLDLPEPCSRSRGAARKSPFQLAHRLKRLRAGLPVAKEHPQSKGAEVSTHWLKYHSCQTPRWSLAGPQRRSCSVQSSRARTRAKIRRLVDHRARANQPSKQQHMWCPMLAAAAARRARVDMDGADVRTIPIREDAPWQHGGRLVRARARSQRGPPRV